MPSALARSDSADIGPLSRAVPAVVAAPIIASPARRQRDAGMPGKTLEPRLLLSDPLVRCIIRWEGDALRGDRTPLNRLEPSSNALSPSSACISHWAGLGATVTSSIKVCVGIVKVVAVDSSCRAPSSLDPSCFAITAGARAQVPLSRGRARIFRARERIGCVGRDGVVPDRPRQ